MSIAYRTACRRPAITETPPTTAGTAKSVARAPLFDVEDEVPDGDVPAPPGLDSLPWQTKLPLMTCLLLLSAWKALQSSVPELCMLKAPLTWVKAGRSTLAFC